MSANDEQPRTEDQNRSYRAAQALPTADKVKLLTEAAKDLSAEDAEAVTKAVEGVLPKPTRRANDAIWLTIIRTFAAVLTAAALALLAAMFLPTGGSVKPELVFAMFTSVASFLAGLLAPSPFKNGAG